MRGATIRAPCASQGNISTLTLMATHLARYWQAVFSVCSGTNPEIVSTWKSSCNWIFIYIYILYILYILFIYILYILYILFIYILYYILFILYIDIKYYVNIIYIIYIYHINWILEWPVIGTSYRPEPSKESHRMAFCQEMVCKKKLAPARILALYG